VPVEVARVWTMRGVVGGQSNSLTLLEIGSGRGDRFLCRSLRIMKARSTSIRAASMAATAIAALRGPVADEEVAGTLTVGEVSEFLIAERTEIWFQIKRGITHVEVK
jgi:hypothetical protein